jgi:hypothetical protein
MSNIKHIIENGRHYAIRNGRRFEVEIHNTGVPATKARRLRPETFATVPLQWAAQALAATNNRKAMVAVWLIYRAWQTKSSTFVVPNTALADYGVTRKVKYLALRQLATAGLITVKWQSRRSPVVTLLGLGPR